MPPRYEIRVSGRLNDVARDAFAGWDVATNATSTVITAEVDQSGLHGLLERIRALGLDLLDVRRTRGTPRRGT